MRESLTRVLHGRMQVAGLKYYEDMQQRVPREETAAIEAVVREAVVDLLHCREAHDASTLFCYAVGRQAHACAHWKMVLCSLGYLIPSQGHQWNGQCLQHWTCHCRCSNLQAALRSLQMISSAIA